MKSVIDHTIRLKLGLSVSQYVFLDCIHSFTTKKKFILHWKDIKICIGYSEEEIIESFRGVKNSGLIEVKEGGKIRTTDLWSAEFVELDTIEETIRYLNIRAGTDFKSKSKATIECLNARQKEGLTLDDFKLIIDSKVEEWAGTDMAQYLRPITLFAPKKCEGYLEFAKSKLNNKSNNKLVM